MLNQSGVRTVAGTTRKTILVDEMNSTAFSCKIANTGVTAVDGKKIVKAGTPLAGSLLARDTAFTVAADSGESPKTSNAVGLLLHDVDVTSGTANGQVLVFGFVDVSKLESDVVTKLTDAAKANMKMIQFVK
nr:MAG TPA: Head decoration protein [Bacteriophage sp.]